MKKQIIFKIIACAAITVTAISAHSYTYKCAPQQTTEFSSEQQELLSTACTDIKGTPNMSGKDLLCVADSSANSKPIKKLCLTFKGKASRRTA